MTIFDPLVILPLSPPFIPNVLVFLFCFVLFVFCLFRAAPVAYGDSQARGLIGATAAGLHHSHSNAGSEPVCKLHHSSWQCRIL